MKLFYKTNAILFLIGAVIEFGLSFFEVDLNPNHDALARCLAFYGLSMIFADLAEVEK